MSDSVSRFSFNSDNNFQECTSYTSENGFTTGCKQSYKKLEDARFYTFYTKLTHGNDFIQDEHELKSKGMCHILFQVFHWFNETQHIVLVKYFLNIFKLLTFPFKCQAFFKMGH